MTGAIEATPQPTPTPAPTEPWYGADADVKGYLENRGWSQKTVNEVALEAIKAHRNAEQHLGVPADRLVRLPADATDEAGWKGVWQRLGAPDDPAKYDFTGIKPASGDLEQSFVDTIRSAAAANHLPAAAAIGVAQALVKYMDGAEASDAAETQAKFTEQQTALKANWGPNYEANLFVAKQTAASMLGKLGMKPEDVVLATNALDQTIGYDKTMEFFRQLGARLGEDRFVQGGGEPPETLTVDGAKSKLKELQADKEWGKRLMAGDAATSREFKALTTIIAGGDDTAASKKPEYVR